MIVVKFKKIHTNQALGTVTDTGNSAQGSASVSKIVFTAGESPIGIFYDPFSLRGKTY